MEPRGQSMKETVTAEVTAFGEHGIKESNFSAGKHQLSIPSIKRQVLLVSKELLLEPRSWEILWPVPSSNGIKVGSFLVAQISVKGYLCEICALVRRILGSMKILLLRP